MCDKDSANEWTTSSILECLPECSLSYLNNGIKRRIFCDKNNKITSNRQINPKKIPHILAQAEKSVHEI